jgi:hypothetical protein
MKDRKQILIACALLIVLAVLGTVMRSRSTARIDLPFDLQSTGVAAEFASTPEEVISVFGADRRYSKEIVEQQYLDFAFIACYVALFVVLGRALRDYDLPAPKAFAWIVVGLALAAGLFDIAEDIAILKIASAGSPTISNVRMFSLPKWGLVFTVVLLESAVFFFWPKLKLWWRLAAAVVGFLLLFAGAAGLLFTLLVAIPDIIWAAGILSWGLVAMLLFLAAAAAWLPPPRTVPLVKR